MENQQSEAKFMCSRCGTVHPFSCIRVVPAWNETALDFLTSYRCMQCWVETLGETKLKTAVLTDEVRQKFCDFLGRHEFDELSQVLRQAKLDSSSNAIQKFLDHVQSGYIVLEP